jgi:branched-chain amino acid transport system substrate-binding protein
MNHQATVKIIKEVDELKKIVFLIIASLLVLGLILPGCAGEGEGEGETEVIYEFPSQVIKIAIAGPMDYIQGKDMWSGAELAKNTTTVTITGQAHTIQLIKVDTKEVSPPWGTYPAEQVENAITVQGANFIFGGFRTESTAGEVNKAMDYKKMFFVSGSATGSILQQVNNNYAKYKYLFRTTPINETFLFVNTICMLAMVGHVVNATIYGYTGNVTLAKPRVAFFAEDLMWTQVPIASVAAAVAGLGYTYLGTWKVSDTATDVSTELNAIQALDPHIIFTFLSGPVGLTYGKQMGSLNISAMSLGINVEGQDPGYWDATKVSGQNWWGAEYQLSLMTWAPNINQTALTQPFLTAYQSATGRFPIYTAATYDGIKTLVKALEATATYNATTMKTTVKADDIIAWFENPANAQVVSSGNAGYYTLAHQALVNGGVPAYAHDLKWGPNLLTGLGVQWMNNGANQGTIKGVWPSAAFSAYTVSLTAALSGALGLNWSGFQWPGTLMHTTPPWMIPIWCAY